MRNRPQSGHQLPQQRPTSCPEPASVEASSQRNCSASDAPAANSQDGAPSPIPTASGVLGNMEMQPVTPSDAMPGAAEDVVLQGACPWLRDVGQPGAATQLFQHQQRPATAAHGSAARQPSPGSAPAVGQVTDTAQSLRPDTDTPPAAEPAGQGAAQADSGGVARQVRAAAVSLWTCFYSHPSVAQEALRSNVSPSSCAKHRPRRVRSGTNACAWLAVLRALKPAL